MASAVQVEGLNALLRDLRQLGDKDTLAAIKAGHKQATDLVVPAAQAEAPKRSGKLSRSVKAKVTQSSASVKAGTGQRVPYAGIIHFGGMTSGRFHGRIRPNPFLERAVAQKLNQIREQYSKELEAAIDAFNG